MKNLTSIQTWRYAYLSLPRTLRFGGGLFLHAVVWMMALLALALPGSSWVEWHWVQRGQFAIAFAGLVVIFYYHNYDMLPRQAGSGKWINYGLLTVMLIIFFESIHWWIARDLRMRIYWSARDNTYLLEPGYFTYWLNNTIPFWGITLIWGWGRYFFGKKFLIRLWKVIFQRSGCFGYFIYCSGLFY